MTENNPMLFFSDNVDAWGPLEWFDRLAKAVHARNRSVRDKDDFSFELYQNIASSSATRLVSDFEDKVRMALTTLRELEKANVAYVDANTELLSSLESLQRENEELRNLADRLKQEAQIHSMGARGANATVNEIYQIISGGEGEPANYHGAEPVRKYVEAAEAEVKHYRAALYEIATNDEYRILTAEEAQTVAQKALASTGGEHHAE